MTHANIPGRAVEFVLGQDPSWPEGYSETEQSDLRRWTRRDLEAAAPFIAAQALRDEAEKFRAIADEAPSPVGRAVRLNDAKALCASADEMEQQ